MEELGTFEYYSETEFMLISKAIQANQDHFEYKEDHLFHKTEAVIYRKRKAIPTFPWNYLCSTSSFIGSILDPVDKNATDHEKKEEYAFRFMLLFLPFRTQQDIQVDGSYQKALQIAHEEKRISEEMIQIAENIQTIHNSLASGIPENPLTAETVLLESADFDNTKAKEDDSYEDLLAGIGEMFSTLTTGHGLKKDSKTFDIKFGNRQTEMTTATKPDLETIIEFSNVDGKKRGNGKDTNAANYRYCQTKKFLNTLALETIITRTQANEDQNGTGKKRINANGTWQSIVEWGENDGLDMEQQTAFEILTATYVLSFYDEATTEAIDSDNYEAFNEGEKNLRKLARRKTNDTAPLVMFITGPAGAGKCKSERKKHTHMSTRTNILTMHEKAKILEGVVAYAKQFSQNIGHTFTDSTILLTAISGSAATEIGGRTTASVYHYMRKKDNALHGDIKFFKDTRLNFVDEISLGGYKSVLMKMSANLKNFTECREHIYGKHAICFLGDFCQLQPVGEDPTYNTRNGIYWEQALNCMVELKGTHRFNQCPEMRRIMPNLRNGVLSEEDRKILNSRVINGREVKKPDPLETKYAVFHNEKRTEINASVFRSHLKTYNKGKSESEIPLTAIVIMSTTKWKKSQRNLSFDQRKVLFEECSESHCKIGIQMGSPFLCLFAGCNLMVTKNIEVLDGIANGTTCLVRKVILKPEAELKQIKMYDCWVNAISIEDVEHIEVEWLDCDKFVGKFRLTSEKGTFRVKYPICEFGVNQRVNTNIELQYLPVIVNHATTGHKLQGKTVASLVIAEWSKLKNWAYVVLSRVKTLDGLFMTHPIPEDIDFSPPSNYLDMMQNLRQTILANPEQVSDMKQPRNYSEPRFTT